MPFRIEFYSMAPNSGGGARGQNVGHVYIIANTLIANTHVCLLNDKRT